MEFQTGVIYLEATGDLTEGYLRYRFEGLIFRGAYFRNFTVCDERSFLNRRNQVVSWLGTVVFPPTNGEKEERTLGTRIPRPA